nr:MAG TPA: hypothetical protein [Caudoviricetes sp.]
MSPDSVDWRLPENRREAFMRFYGYHLRYKAHPGMVYLWLPYLSESLGLSLSERAWLTWLNGNTQNPVTSFLILREAPSAKHWRKAVDFVSDNYTRLQWDTDRRYHKSKFGEATERLVGSIGTEDWDIPWANAATIGWEGVWSFARSLPYMGRLSAWSMAEYARILLDGIPDSYSLMLDDKSGSKSHRNGLCILLGYDAAYWSWEDAKPHLADAMLLGEDLLEEARQRFPECGDDVSYLTLESALCTYKSWHKPNRRYPGVYSDMSVDRLLWAEERWGKEFQPFWDSRMESLPSPLLSEWNAEDPGLSRQKQNLYLETGTPYGMGWVYPDMMSELEERILSGDTTNA